MVEVSQYIRKLLFEQDCVIIPDFGGLLVHQVQASYDTTLRRFQPARKRVAFNEVLRLDDGLLSFHLASQLSISREQAVQVLRNYTDQIKSELRNRGTFVLEGVGHFTRNHEGKLVFEPTQEQNFYSEWFGLTAFESPALQNSDRMAESVLFERVEVQEVLLEPVSLEKKASGSFGWLKWVAAASVVVIASWGILMLPTTSNSEQGTLNPFHALTSLKSWASTPLDLANDLGQEEIVQTSVVIPPATPAEMTPVATETEKITKEVVLESTPQPEQVKAAVADATEALRVHIIAGGFTTKFNAKKYIKELSSKGITGAYIVEEENPKLIKVSVGGFETRKQANSAMAGLEAVYGDGLWIYTTK
jgi:hypothetical protein